MARDSRGGRSGGRGSGRGRSSCGSSGRGSSGGRSSSGASPGTGRGRGSSPSPPPIYGAVPPPSMYFSPEVQRTEGRNDGFSGGAGGPRPYRTSSERGSGETPNHPVEGFAIAGSPVPASPLPGRFPAAPSPAARFKAGVGARSSIGSHGRPGSGGNSNGFLRGGSSDGEKPPPGWFGGASGVFGSGAARVAFEADKEPGIWKVLDLRTRGMIGQSANIFIFNIYDSLQHALSRYYCMNS